MSTNKSKVKSFDQLRDLMNQNGKTDSDSLNQQQQNNQTQNTESKDSNK